LEEWFKEAIERKRGNTAKIKKIGGRTFRGGEEWSHTDIFILE